MKITLTCNIRPKEASEQFVEWDEPSTIHTISRCLSSMGHQVRILDCHGIDIEREIRRDRPDLVFNIAEGLSGETRESLVPEILERLKIPYTGSGPQTLSHCLNKAKSKQILRENGIWTPDWITSRDVLENLPASLDFPVIVKPLYEGSSRGIMNHSVVFNSKELSLQTRRLLDELDEPVIVEQFLSGREFTVALLEDALTIEVLPIVEIDFSSLPDTAHPIYGYEAKWIWDTETRPLRIFKCPARLTPALKNDIRKTAREAFSALECKDWARIDLRLDDCGRVHVIELNPLPGIIPDPRANSCFPKAARAAGYTSCDLLRRVIDSAMFSVEIEKAAG